jgi:protein-S-isoprenylcysteine O-methyltransferase Ste14
MSLQSEFDRQGAFLFRHRSVLPLLTLPLFVVAFRSYGYIADSHAVTEVWEVGCLLVSLLGLGVRILTIGHAPKDTSGRNTQGQVAGTLNTTGMYSVVRHPLYLGNYLMWLGISMFLHTWWFVALMTALFALYYERVMFAEEAFLRQKFGDAFERWADATRAVIPGRIRWRSPQLSFSWRTVLRREYPGFFAVTIVFAGLEIVGDSLVEGRVKVDLPWVGLLLIGAVAFLLLRTLKKKSRLLHVDGR